MIHSRESRRYFKTKGTLALNRRKYDRQTGCYSPSCAETGIFRDSLLGHRYGLCLTTATALCMTLLWRHNERDGVSNHRRPNCLQKFTDQWKHRSSVSLAFVREIPQWQVNSPHKGPAMRKMLPFDEVVMEKLALIFYEVAFEAHRPYHPREMI